MSILEQFQTLHVALREARQGIDLALDDKLMATSKIICCIGKAGVVPDLQETDCGREISSDLDFSGLDHFCRNSIHTLKEVKRLMEDQKEDPAWMKVLNTPEMTELYDQLHKARKAYRACADRVNSKFEEAFGQPAPPGDS